MKISLIVLARDEANLGAATGCRLASRNARLIASVTVLLAAGLSLVAQSPAPLHVQSAAGGMIADLGCANCHAELRIANVLTDRIPDLSSAGLRYRPAYLFEYLQNPLRIRRHLGRARMPDFRLSPQEALALTAFLGTQGQVSNSGPQFPREIVNLSSLTPQSVSKQQFQTELAAGLVCLTCHTLDGKGGTQAVELASISYRLQPDWVRQYLVAPSVFGVPPATMPAQFYHVTADGKHFKEIMPQPARRIQTLTDYLFGLSLDKRKAMEQRITAARASFPEAKAALGESIFRALNCAACHRHHTIAPRTENAAPDLTREGNRVNQAWLEGYLKHPVAIRPFGHRPGDGSRMPDYRLSDEEVAELSGFLLSQRAGMPAASVEFQPRKLSAFSTAKAKLLLEQKVSCLGCHRLGERGGRIGPDLTNVRTRLRGEYVYSIIKEPRAVAPHSVMPRIPLPPDTVQLLANFLLQQEASPQPEGYLSLAENPLIPLGPSGGTSSPTASARQNYLTHCATCHGEQGQGDGFNSRFLPVKPTSHADASHMTKRPDDTLYDGVHSGGYILNKSQMMPPWGQSFSAMEIKELVRFMRTLCRCEGPAWSRDN